MFKYSTAPPHPQPSSLGLSLSASTGDPGLVTSHSDIQTQRNVDRYTRNIVDVDRQERKRVDDYTNRKKKL